MSKSKQEEILKTFQDSMNKVFDSFNGFLKTEKLKQSDKIDILKTDLASKCIALKNSMTNYVNEVISELKDEKDFSEMSRSECVDYIKENDIKVPFDVDEAGGDELRQFLMGMDDDTAPNEDDKWVETLKNLFSDKRSCQQGIKQKEEPYYKDGSKIEIRFEK